MSWSASVVSSKPHETRTESRMTALFNATQRPNDGARTQIRDFLRTEEAPTVIKTKVRYSVMVLQRGPPNTEVVIFDGASDTYWSLKEDRGLHLRRGTTPGDLRPTGARAGIKERRRYGQRMGGERRVTPSPPEKAEAGSTRTWPSSLPPPDWPGLL
ncbi:hypothetical protein MRX96_033477 [Rhipicephalus microplus]